MRAGLVPGATRSLLDEEKILVLKNQILLLEDEIADLHARIQALVDDNAEVDFLADVNARARTEEIDELYRENAERIDELRREVGGKAADVRIYKDVLADRFGVRLAGESS